MLRAEQIRVFRKFILQSPKENPRKLEQSLSLHYVEANLQGNRLIASRSHATWLAAILSNRFASCSWRVLTDQGRVEFTELIYRLCCSDLGL